MASDSSALPRVTFQTPEKPEEESSHRRLGKLTIKYNRKDLQRWLELEEWINAQLQELYQYQVLFVEHYCRVTDKQLRAAMREPIACIHPCSQRRNYTIEFADTPKCHCAPPENRNAALNIVSCRQCLKEELTEETEAAAPEPEIDLEDLLEVPNEEQKLKLQEILHECSSPTEDFITELLSRLKGLRKVTNPQKK